MPLPKDSTHLVVDADHRTVVLSDLPKAHRDAIVSALRKVVRRGSELHGVKGKFSAGPDTVMVRFE